MRKRVNELFAFVAKNPKLRSIEEILDAFGTRGDSDRQQLRDAYFEKCGKMLRKALASDELRKAIESSQRQQRRLKQKKKKKDMPRRAAAPIRAQQRLRSSIIPELVIQGDVRVDHIQENIRSSITDADQPLQPVSDQPLQPVSDQPLQPVSDQPLQRDVDQPLQRDVDQPLQPVSDQPLQPESAELDGLGEGLELDSESVQGDRGLDGSRLAARLAARIAATTEELGEEANLGHRLLASIPSLAQRELMRREKAMAKVRFLLKLNPAVDDDAVTDVARQMKDAGLLLPEDGGVRITWPEVDLILSEAELRGAEVEVRGAEVEVRGVSSPTRFSGESGDGGPREKMPANRIDLATSLLFKDFADVVSGMREEDQAAFSERLSSLEANRLGRVVEFVKELRAARVPEHAAALRVMDMNSIGQPGLDSAAAGGTAKELAETLRGKTCEYNCEAMKQGIQRLLAAQIAATLVSSLVSSGADAQVLDSALRKFAQVNSQALAVIDYLNQGMKKARPL
jgi:hypothetical protein